MSTTTPITVYLSTTFSRDPDSLNHALHPTSAEAWRYCAKHVEDNVDASWLDDVTDEDTLLAGIDRLKELLRMGVSELDDEQVDELTELWLDIAGELYLIREDCVIDVERLEYALPVL